MDLLCEWLFLDDEMLVDFGIDNDLAGEFWLQLDDSVPDVRHFLW